MMSEDFRSADKMDSLSDHEAKVLSENTDKDADEFSMYIEDVWLSLRELLVLWLKQYGGMKTGEIAEALDVDPSTISTNLNRIRNKLEKSERTVQEIDERKL